MTKKLACSPKSLAIQCFVLFRMSKLQICIVCILEWTKTMWSIFFFYLLQRLCILARPYEKYNANLTVVPVLSKNWNFFYPITFVLLYQNKTEFYFCFTKFGLNLDDSIIIKLGYLIQRKPFTYYWVAWLCTKQYPFEDARVNL